MNQVMEWKAPHLTTVKGKRVMQRFISFLCAPLALLAILVSPVAAEESGTIPNLVGVKWTGTWSSSYRVYARCISWSRQEGKKLWGGLSGGTGSCSKGPYKISAEIRRKENGSFWVYINPVDIGGWTERMELELKSNGGAEGYAWLDKYQGVVKFQKQ